MTFGQYDVLIAGIEVGTVTLQVRGVVNGRLLEPVVKVVAKEVIPGSKIVVDTRIVLVKVILRGREIVDGVADLSRARIRARRGKSLLKGNRCLVEIGARNMVVSVFHACEGVIYLLAGGIAEVRGVPATCAEVAVIGIAERSTA